MARMFATEFDYRQKTYTATVIISGFDGGDKTVAVQVPEALQDVVPERKIVVEHYNEMQKPRDGAAKDGSSKDPALVASILSAVNNHEKDKPAGSLWSE
ncbi:MAG TPA: hypothetical protein VKA92_03235 [Segetibacter sp.]|nr:hypothetical protein [Segetibacter sp.]